nr:heparan-alpha-glucosaminide N-acetyltransferase domain-containing protein [Candidatus Njordarchaeum guaymaensis]
MATDTASRVDFVDAFRGIAILIMVFIQVFDWFAVSNIYTDPPWYVSQINSITWLPPSIPFTFVSGMSLFFMSRRITERKLLLKKALRRYGALILISLPFTVIMWDLNTYLTWNEAIQGIGVTAIVAAAMLIYLKPSEAGTLALVISMAFVQFLGRRASDLYLSPYYPVIPRLSDSSGAVVSILLNALLRGWFSLANLLPILLSGYLFLLLVLEKRNVSKSFLMGAVFLLVSLALHIGVQRVDYYNRSFSFTFFAVGEPLTLYSAMYVLFQRIPRKIISPLINLGRVSLQVYLGHYLLILKVGEILGFRDALPDPVALALTFSLTFLVGLGALIYRKSRSVLT